MAVKRTERKTAKQTTQGEAEGRKLPADGTMSAEAPRTLDAFFAPLAAVASMALAMVALAAVIIYLVVHRDLQTWMEVTAIVKIVLLVGLCGVGVVMLRGRPWAQQTLLTVWLLVMAYSAVILLFYLMWGTPVLWEESLGWPLLAVILPVIGCSAAATVLLVLATAGKSRVRYASMVAVSVVVAITLAAGANMICQKGYKAGGFGYRREIEDAKDEKSAEDYGISGRMISICSGVKDPIKLTCVYLPPEDAKGDGKEAEKRRDRLWQYLQDLKEHMAGLGRPIEIAKVTSPIDQAKLQAGLRQRHRDAQPEHIKLLEEDFLVKSPVMVKALLKAETQWGEMPEDAFLTQFGLSAGVADSFRASAKGLAKIVKEIRDAEIDMSVLPDYADLSSKLRESLDDARERMETIITVVKKVEGVPAPVAKSRKGVLDAMAKADKTVEQMIETLDGVKEGKIKTAQVANVLQALAKAAGPAAEELRVAADKLRLAAGEENSTTIRNSAFFAMSILVPLPNGTTARARGELVSNIEQIMAPNLDKIARAATDAVKHLKPETQLETLKALAQMADHWAKQFAAARARTGEALAGLAKPDEVTAKAFKQARDGTLFKDLLIPVGKLLATVDGLPDVKDAAMSSDVYKDNIVIIEVGRKKTKVATFDEVFPPRLRLTDRMGAAAGRRAFAGDSIIASKMLKMSRGAFGTVVLTYFEPPPQTMIPRRPPVPGPPLPIPVKPARSNGGNVLAELRRVMEAGNFTVEEWNLATRGSRPKYDRSLPRVLLLLPPPVKSPMPGFGGMPTPPSFGPDQVAEIRREIDSGTAALFLTLYQPALMASSGFGPPVSVPPNLALNEYFENDWGIRVAHDARVILGNPDPGRPGYFKINVKVWTYLPVNTFSDHAIGQPLIGQRVLWDNACPLEQAKDHADNILAVVRRLAQPFTEKHDADVKTVISSIQDRKREAEEKDNAPAERAFDEILTAVEKDNDAGIDKVVTVLEQALKKAPGVEEIKALLETARPMKAKRDADIEGHFELGILIAMEKDRKAVSLEAILALAEREKAKHDKARRGAELDSLLAMVTRIKGRHDADIAMALAKVRDAAVQAKEAKHDEIEKILSKALKTIMADMAKTGGGIKEILAALEKATEKHADAGEVKTLLAEMKDVKAKHDADIDNILTMVRTVSQQARMMGRTDIAAIVADAQATMEQVKGRNELDIEHILVIAELAKGKQPIEKMLTVIRRAIASKNINSEKVLTVPQTVTNIWGTRTPIRQLANEIQSVGVIRPAYGGAAGDVRTPIDLAVAAAREKNTALGVSGTSRLVVLSVGASMLDWQLTRPVGVYDDKGGFSVEPPPKLNATLVINSLYWLTAETNYIAAGPEPEVDDSLDLSDKPAAKKKRIPLKVMCLAGFPLIVLAIGGLVMFFRKR